MAQTQLNNSQLNCRPPTKVATSERFKAAFTPCTYNFSVTRKQLIGLVVLQTILPVGLTGAAIWLTSAVSSHELQNQAKSELSLSEINYNLKLDRAADHLQNSSDSKTIAETAIIYNSDSKISNFEKPLKQILENAVKTGEIDSATLVGINRQIVVSVNPNQQEKSFNLQKIVDRVFAAKEQITATEIIAKSEVQKQWVFLPPGMGDRPVLVSYTAVPVKDPKNQTVIAVLVLGKTLNQMSAVAIRETLNLQGGYRAIYTPQPDGKFVLASSQTNPKNPQFSDLLPDKSLLKSAVAADGKLVAADVQIGSQIYAVAARSLNNLAGKPAAILVHGIPKTSIDIWWSKNWLLVLSAVAVATPLLAVAVPRRKIAKPANSDSSTADENGESNPTAEPQQRSHKSENLFDNLNLSEFGLFPKKLRVTNKLAVDFQDRNFGGDRALAKPAPTGGSSTKTIANSSIPLAFQPIELPANSVSNHPQPPYIEQEKSSIALNQVQQAWQDLNRVNLELQQEILDRQNAQKPLRQSEALLQAILDNSTAMIHIKDVDGKYLLTNRHVDNLFQMQKSK
ncbi:MAG: hypothetical protein LH628_24570 [Microcoleus sp. CAN_BIN18]|nr:hypothetical protein [Microcoleus sp. CAN_BIN18]